MKKPLSILVFIGSSFSFIHAQDKGTMCKADMLANKPDVVVQKDFTNISKVEGISISVEQIMSSNGVSSVEKLSALDLEYTFIGTGGSTVVSVLLDPDETDAVISFIQNLSDNIFKTPAPPGDREYSFLSKSGFEIGCYWNKGWNTYVKLDTHNTHTNVELNRESLMVFQSFLKQARTKML